MSIEFQSFDIAEPVIPSRTRYLTDFIAGDKSTCCSVAFSKAIESIVEEGGGRLVVPEGVWHTGAIHLKSRIELNLLKGAEIHFSTDYDAYLPVVYQQRAGVRCYNYSPLIYAYGCEDIAITGEGIINGHGSAWWLWSKKQPGMFRLMKMCASRSPVEERIFGTVEDGVRPDFIQFINCCRVKLEGVTFIDGPSWNIHPVWCEDVTIKKVKVVGRGPNNDGIDPDGCRNVLIENCDIDVGDDAICIKSGRDQEGWDSGRACENILIQNCRVKAGHGAVVIGSEMSGGVSNVRVNNLTADGTDRGIRIKSRRGRGGLIENLLFENIFMKNIKYEAIVINMQYADGSVGDIGTVRGECDMTVPVVHNVTIRKVTCHSAGQSLRFIGLPEKPIRGLFLENVRIDQAAEAQIEYVEDFHCSR